MNTPRVVVLLATLNGMPWLEEQLASVVAQRGVSVRIVASDDGSTDGTREVLDKAGVTLLEARTTTGGAAQNFCYLIENAPVDDDEYVAFCDQDDIWRPDKLIRQIMLLDRYQADGTSSSVEALYPNGETKLIRKNYPQRKLDFVCESAGPGATYLLSPRGFATVRADLVSGKINLEHVGFHDWLVYALLRAHQMGWVIDRWPMIAYRQHETNEMGANSGLAAIRRRLGMLHRGWYRRQFALTAQWCSQVCEDENLRADLEHVHELLVAQGLGARLKLAAMCWQLRRSIRDRAILAATLLVGLW